MSCSCSMSKILKIVWFKDHPSFKGQCHEKSVQTETVGSYRLGTKDVSDPNFIVLRCIFIVIVIVDTYI